MKNRMFIITIILLLPISAQAATYYLDGTLSGDCDGSSYHYDVSTRTCNQGPGQVAWNDLASANSNLKAGDTLYMRGGTSVYEVYDVTAQSGAGEGIQPDNSGTDYDHMITYATYNNEMVHLQGNADTTASWGVGIYINQKNYIKVTGSAKNYLKISKCSKNISIGQNAVGVPVTYSRYNEIAYVWSTDTMLNSNYAGKSYNQQVTVYKNAQYNWIHNSIFERHGYQQAGDLFVVGMSSGWTGEDKSADNFNVIENCEIARAGHSTFFPAGKYNVYRNNYLHNEAWNDAGANFKYGFRDVINHQVYDNTGHNIFEGNRVGHAAKGPSQPSFGSVGLAWANSNNIMRYNALFGNGSNAIEFRASDYADNYYVRSNKNYLYNNTFYYNGMNALDAAHIDVVKFGYSSNVDHQSGTNIYWQATQENVVKNNLFYDNFSNQNNDAVFGTGYYNLMADAQACPSSKTQGCNTISNNYNDDAGENTNPDFVNTTLTSYDSWILPNLNLQTGSPAIDKGSFLTQANGSGSSSATLIVYDASYFQDGKFGSASGCDPSKWPAGVDIQADWIAIGTVDNIVQISSINYSTNTITLVSPMAWQDKAPIWLYKKSDGMQVLYGSGPDMGAYEATSSSGSNTTVVQTPKNLRPE